MEPATSALNPVTDAAVHYMETDRMVLLSFCAKCICLLPRRLFTGGTVLNDGCNVHLGCFAGREDSAKSFENFVAPAEQNYLWLGIACLVELKRRVVTVPRRCLFAGKKKLKKEALPDS